MPSSKHKFILKISAKPYICSTQALMLIHQGFVISINYAKVAQLVEHDLAKVGVASSNLVFRSKAFPVSGKAFLFKSIYPRLLHSG